MHAHFLQHVPFETLGSVDTWLRSIKAVVSGTKLFETPSLPPLAGIDLLIVLGGPMSVNDEAALPWLAQEKRFIRRAIDAGTAVLGICLGAQLIASAMGARVYPHRTKEIGWFPVFSTQPAAHAGLFRFPKALTVFHWHGETFDLPEGATHLARSTACEHQAYQLGRRVLAFQCHLETTAQSAHDLVAHCRAELVPAQTIQSASDILQVDAAAYAPIHTLMHAALNFLTPLHARR